MIEKRNSIYIWNELHSIVVVKYKVVSVGGKTLDTRKSMPMKTQIKKINKVQE